MTDNANDNEPLMPLSQDVVEQHVICVDDDTQFLASMRYVLPEKVNQYRNSEIWYRFSFFHDPREAYDAIKELRAEGEVVAMVISDQKMPGITGTELLEQVKTLEPETIRVLLTGFAGLETAIEAINSTLLDKYLTKPIEDEHDFVVTIRHLLDGFDMRRTIGEQNRMIHELYQFANTLNGMESFEQTLEYIVYFTKKTLQCGRVSIMLIEDDVLRIKASSGIPEEVRAAARIPVGRWISGRVFQSRRAVYARSRAEIPFFDANVDTTVQPFASLPLLYAGLTSGERSLGVINVTNREHDKPFSDTDLEVLTYIANTASIAIHNQLNREEIKNAYYDSRAKAAALEYRMTHDALTELPNRTMLMERLVQALEIVSRAHTALSVLVMDIDRFREINDTLGHHNGDILLQEVGARLGTFLLSVPHTLARLGGDEFAVLLPTSGHHGAKEVANRIADGMRAPFAIENYNLDISLSIGIATAPDQGEDPNLLLQRAEVAMYVAKRSASGVRVYEPELDSYNPRRLTIVGDLRSAIDRNELVLYYQPKLDLKRGEVTGVEALVRWQHPQLGFMPPDQFIPLAEQTGLIKPLTEWVLDAALRQCRAWNDSGMALSMAVNLSPRNLNDEGLTDFVIERLKVHGVSARSLELEITESMLMESPALAIDLLSRFSALGIRLTIDDFGTGYSSLAYLKRFAVNEVKIDRSFIRDLGSENGDAHIVQSIIDLGHNLGLTVVAEGVETKDTYKTLMALGCDVIQGHYLSAAVSADELGTWLAEYRVLGKRRVTDAEPTV